MTKTEKLIIAATARPQGKPTLALYALYKHINHKAKTFKPLKVTGYWLNELTDNH